MNGLGIADLPEDEFGAHLAEGRLVRVLQDWCEPFGGFHLTIPAASLPARDGARPATSSLHASPARLSQLRHITGSLGDRRQRFFHAGDVFMKFLKDQIQ